MADLVVIDDELSRFGLRCVHLMRIGGQVDLAEARGRYIPADAEEVIRCAWEEKELGAHHLVLSWPAREVICLQENGSSREAVMWWIGEKSQLVEGGKATMREAIDMAGTLFQLRMGRSPVRALVRKLPKGATKTAPVEGIGEVELVEANWAPAGFVVIE
jgi:hypothetical protein